MILRGTDDSDKPLLLRALEMLVAGPEDIVAVAEACRDKVRRKAKAPMTPEDERIAVANEIIDRYAKVCGRVGAVTAGAGAIPGVGTVVSLIGATAADLVVSMKYQVEMVAALAHLFGHDISNEEEQQLIYTIAGLGVATQAGVLSVERFTVKSIKKAVKKLIKKKWKKWLFDLFKKLGLKLTEKGVLKAIPFGIGVGFSYWSNKRLTRYIGRRARDYFLREST